MSDDLREIEQQILADIWTTDEPMRVLRELCDDIGHRFGGSESEREGAEFLKQKMLDYGLENVRIEEFSLASWERGAASLKLVSPVERDFSVVAMPYCPPADLTAEIIDVGEGELADYERLGRDAIQGRIVLTDAETNKPNERKSHRIVKYNWALEYGAVGIIYINQNPGMLHITGALFGHTSIQEPPEKWEVPIPGVGVSWEAGSAIRRLVERSDGEGTVKLKLENKTFPSTSRNVIGEIVGSEFPNEVVLMGGHFDGHDIAQGAGDDGAGTVTGLEAARVLVPHKGKLKRTVRVVCFGSEEIGLLGSFHHAQNTDPDSYRFVMNLDGAGRGMGGQEQLTLTDWPELQPWFEKWIDEHNYSFDIRQQVSAYSDHYPFALRGVPNGSLNSKDSTAGMIGRGYGHTEADTLDKVFLRGMQMSAALVARLVASIANADDWPAVERRTDEQVREMLEKNKFLAAAIRTGYLQG
jgi:hypothetical protein